MHCGLEEKMQNIIYQSSLPRYAIGELKLIIDKNSVRYTMSRVIKTKSP